MSAIRVLLMMSHQDGRLLIDGIGRIEDQGWRMDQKKHKCTPEMEDCQLGLQDPSKFDYKYPLAYCNRCGDF